MATNRFEEETRRAIGEASRHHARSRIKGDDSTGARGVREGMDHLTDGARFLLGLAAIGLVIALLDGARREYGEFYANLAAFRSPIAVRRAADKLPVTDKMELRNKDAVSTAADGNATVLFPDGSAVFVEPSTRFEVQLLDYNRGPKRDRSFLLRFGSIFTRISKRFGKKGETLICTPNAVAAARGTGFAVRFDPGSGTTFVEVIDGRVALRNAGGRIEISRGQTGTAVGNQPPMFGSVSRTLALQQRFNALARLDNAPSPLENYELVALNFLDPALRLVALNPGGFDMGQSDWARRAATRQALKLVQQSLEAASGDVPDVLNPVTLTELGFKDADRDKILGAFAGYSIDRYEKRGQNLYRVVVRSRDSDGTPFELTETGIRQVK